MEETQALPSAMPTAPRGLGGEAEGSSEIPGQLKRRVSFSTPGGGGDTTTGSRRHSAFSFNDRGGGGGGGASASVGMLAAPQALGGAAGPETSTHKGPVLTLDVDEDGSLGVSGGADKLLVVYSIQQVGGQRGGSDVWGCLCVYVGVLSINPDVWCCALCVWCCRSLASRR